MKEILFLKKHKRDNMPVYKCSDKIYSSSEYRTGLFQATNIKDFEKVKIK